MATTKKVVKKKPVKKVAKKKVVKKKISRQVFKPAATKKRPGKAGIKSRVSEGIIPVREEKADFEYISSPLLSKQESEKSVLRIVVPIVILIVIVAGAGYLYFTGQKIIPTDKPVTMKPAVTTLEAEKPKETAPAAETEAVEAEKEPAAPTEGEGDYYTVQTKDQLNEIGKKYYGNYKDWKKIYETNKEKIGNPNLIFPGQKLIIPR